MEGRTKPSTSLVMAAAFIVAVLAVTSCGSVADRQRLQAIQSELDSLEYPYAVDKIHESSALVGRDFDAGSVDSNVAGRSYVTDLTDLLDAASKTLEWLPSEGWDDLVTSCRVDDGALSVVRILSNMDKGDWVAQLSISLNFNDQGRVVVSPLAQAPPAEVASLPPPEGEAMPCWEAHS